MVAPTLAWGLLGRGLGLVYAIAFSSMAVQMTALCGSQGASPFSATLRQIEHGLSTNALAILSHSLFWFVGTSDAALTLLPLAGSLVACLAATGIASRLGLTFCWLILRSLDLPVGLLYPWDKLLFEAGALAILLPPLPALWGGDAVATTFASSAPPHPWLGFAFRWLLARVLLGFGKKKFVGTSLKHSCYIKNFLVAQPLPSPAGWLACRLPLPLFQLALLGMFVVECIAPLFLFSVGTPRVTAAAAIGALMIGIQLCGNFGHFNLLTIVLCAGGLDAHGSAFDPLPPLTAQEAAMRASLAAYVAFSSLFFLFDSWCVRA